MKRLIVSLIFSLFFTSNLYAEILPEAVIKSQKEDQDFCFQDRISKCLQKCIASSDTNCRNLCETNARHECRQAGE